MKRPLLVALIFLLLLYCACEPTTNGANSHPSTTTQADATLPADADTAPSSTTTTPPNIRTALQCASRPSFGTTNQVLQRAEINLGVFPDAICNDGSTAALYFRPYSGEANRNKWVIHLRGGGSCGGSAECAARWCGCDEVGPGTKCPFAKSSTFFTMVNMISDRGTTLGATGVLLRGDATKPNPLANYNQVSLIYCSSDNWAGTRRDVPMKAIPNPFTGEEVAYSIHFLGAKILDASIATLRADGVSRLIYTLQNANTTMPDLDQADTVVVAGDSAGGAGVIQNLDRIAETLRTHNSACTSASPCPLQVVGLIDAIVGPDRSRLDFTQSRLAPDGLIDYSAYIQWSTLGGDTHHGKRYDESCVAWHQANRPGTEGECTDLSHVIRHHVTTPFFVRMALLDTLIWSDYHSLGLRDPELGELTKEVFGRVLQRELAKFPKLPQTAEEGELIPVAPGVFAPGCTKHDTLTTDSEVYGTTITPSEGKALRLFDLFESWRTGGNQTSALTMTLDRSDTICGDQ